MMIDNILRELGGSLKSDFHKDVSLLHSVNVQPRSTMLMSCALHLPGQQIDQKQSEEAIA